MPLTSIGEFLMLYFEKHGVSNEKSLNLYVKDIDRFSFLTIEQEKEARLQMKMDVRSAEEILLKGNLRKFFSTALYFHHKYQWLPLSELISVANMALITAIKEFDEKKANGFRFSTYAFLYYVRPSIFKKIREDKDLLQMSSCHCSLCTVDELIADELAKSPYEITEKNQITKKFTEILHNFLSECEYNVLCRFYGIGYEGNCTLEEVGQDLGFTRETARLLKDNAIKKLRRTQKIKKAIREIVVD